MFDPMELVRAAHEAAAEQALHRSRTFLHQVFQQLSEAEADLLIAAEASFMEHSDLGQALRGPLSNLETALRDHLERHRRQEAEASREALHALASQLRAQYDEQMQKQAEVLGFSEKALPRHAAMRHTPAVMLCTAPRLHHHPHRAARGGQAQGGAHSGADATGRGARRARAPVRGAPGRGGAAGG